MKKLIILFVFTISFSSFAQQGINYKALIKDGSGNVLASSPVTIQFIIYEGAALTNNVYQESHTVNTDANGIVIVNIGKGTTSDVFASINWGVDQHFLNVQINTGAGLVDMGTTEFMAVPYALYSTNAANVSGLEKITENGKTGWRLIGQNPANYGDINFSAVDLSTSFNSSTTLGATGNASFATGERTTASGKRSTSMGYATKANAYTSTSIGAYNIGGGNATTWISTDPLFEVGNGSFGANSNALTILKNGTITAPSFDLAEITNAKALITKEYADTNLTASGLEKITEGGNTGWRIAGRVPEWFGNIGNNAIDLSYSSSTSTINGATGNFSFAMGNKAIASGDNSIAIGLGTKVTTHVGIAFGKYNIGGGSTTSWVGTDPYFEIGNGFSNTARSNAFTVYKNGNTDVNGVFRAQNNVWPTSSSGVEIAYDSSLSRGYVQSYDRGTSAWKDLVLGGLNVYPVINGTINLGTSSNKWKAVYAVNGTIQTSDRRLKKEINNITYGLNTVMKLRPVSYKWKKGNQDLNLGLIAQDVQKLIPEVVDVGTDKDKTLGMKYTELLPVLISAIQEQQNIIEQEKTKNQLLRAELTTQMKAIENLTNRMEIIEANNQ